MIDLIKICGEPEPELMLRMAVTSEITAEVTTFVPSESLATVAEADAYHASRGAGVAWSALDVERKEQLLRQGYDYLAAVYGAAWPIGQEFGVDADGLVPAAMMKANAILALKAKAGSLMPEATPQKIKVKVGPLETEYAEQAQSVNGLRAFPDILRLVVSCLPPPVATGSAFMSPIVRN